jgi:hypothetical protein
MIIIITITFIKISVQYSEIPPLPPVALAQIQFVMNQTLSECKLPRSNLILLLALY